MRTPLAVLASLALLSGPVRAASLEALSREAASGFNIAAELPVGALRPLPQPPIAGAAVGPRGVQPRFSPGDGVDGQNPQAFGRRPPLRLHRDVQLQPRLFGRAG